MSEERRRWRRIDAILGEALDMPREARAAFLDRACEGDSSLRREVENLLNTTEEDIPNLSEPLNLLFERIARQDDRFEGEPEAEDHTPSTTSRNDRSSYERPEWLANLFPDVQLGFI